MGIENSLEKIAAELAVIAEVQKSMLAIATAEKGSTGELSA